MTDPIILPSLLSPDTAAMIAIWHQANTEINKGRFPKNREKGIIQENLKELNCRLRGFSICKTSLFSYVCILLHIYYQQHFTICTNVISQMHRILGNENCSIK